jgi:hypothetical protein
LEEYIYNNQDEIDVIVVPSINTLLENNLHAILGKTEFMASMNIIIIFGSKEEL